jgi:hypothetical protein
VRIVVQEGENAIVEFVFRRIALLIEVPTQAKNGLEWGTVLICPCRRPCTSLELELRRQIDTAVGRAPGGIRESHDVVGDAEETRT